jgi:non-specific serine/threonine protein kinase/serine/threonine-protein kinase
MEPDRFLHAERLFHEALALTPSGRERYVQKAAGEDSELASRVHRMIRFAECRSPTAALLDHRPATPTDDGENSKLVGATIGRYRIDDLIGEGGFGAVYKARQEHPVRRLVALKILKCGMDSRQVIARFDAERQALAMMEHPNIARVFDAGQTEPALGSRPYFVMELVSGAPITSYCDEHRIDSKARLELFIAVCQAVQHAHQKGIIHRDLKPSNILVTRANGAAVPKIIDFGIAKALDQQPLTHHTLVTEARQLLGTPRYMSPEQADLDLRNIDTRSDIYSLGVVLYELLTGSTPLDGRALRDASFSGLQQMIRNEVVERPSTRLTRLVDEGRDVARRQNTDLPTLRRRLRGDLDWIVLKALDHDRDRRYNSAAALADDIQRHLNHEPVLAGPPGPTYRIGKFIRRHRVGVVAAALIALAVIGGAIGTTVGMLRARDAADEAIAVNDFMREVLTSVEAEKQGADVRLIEVLGNASAAASQRFAGHPRAEARTRDLLGQVYVHLAMWRESTAELRKALALWQHVAGNDDRRTLTTNLRLATSLINLEESREAERILEGLVPQVDRAFGPEHELSLEARTLLGAAHAQRGRIDQAVSELRQLRQQAAGDDDRSQVRILEILISALRQQRTSAEGVERDAALDEIETLSRELIERSLRYRGAKDVGTIEAQISLAEILAKRGQYSAAADLARSALNASQNRVVDCHKLRLDAMYVLALALNGLGDRQQPAELCVRAIECMRQKVAADHPVLLSAMSDALPYLENAGRWSEGEAMAREVSEQLRKFGSAHATTFHPDLYLAKFVSAQNRFDEAEPVFQSLLSREDAEATRLERAQLHLFYGSHLTLRKQFDEAERQLLRAVELVGDVPVDVVVEFIALYEAWGKPEKAAAYRRVRDEMIGPTSNPEHG